MILRCPIETKRLRLREFIESDWEAMLQASDDNAMRFFDSSALTEEDAKTCVGSIISSQVQNPRMHYAFAVELKQNGQVIGYCDLVIRSPIECRMAYSGFRYIPKYWGKGYGTEAEKAILAFGFEALGLHRVSCICEYENIASLRIMEKCGMRREGHGILDHWNPKKKKWHDTYYYAILKDEWKEAKDTSQPITKPDQKTGSFGG